MAERLKDLFFTSAFVDKLSLALRHAHPAFDERKFRGLIYDGAWESKELLQRMHHLAHCLHAVLPEAYAKALEILKQIAPQFAGFEALLFPDFVEQFGWHDWERSLPALKFFTQFGSAEFAIRPFLLRDAARALALLHECAADAHPLVRRLASEGCRPRLPWAVALPAFKKDPRPLLPILEKLQDDEADTVRRSVANNLNDIAKDHPALVLEICERWKGRSQRTDWIVKHACRSLLKAKNKRALKLFGFAETRQARIEKFKLAKKRMTRGEDLRFAFELHIGGKRASKVRLEYSIDFVKANGETSRKVFQLGEKEFAPGVHAVSKRYSTSDKTTRKHYAGKHRVALVVNGQEQAEAMFVLL